MEYDSFILAVSWNLLIIRSRIFLLLQVPVCNIRNVLGARPLICLILGNSSTRTLRRAWSSAKCEAPVAELTPEREQIPVWKQALELQLQSEEFFKSLLLQTEADELFKIREQFNNDIAKVQRNVRDKTATTKANLFKKEKRMRHHLKGLHEDQFDTFVFVH